MLTKNYNPKIMTWAAVIAITLPSSASSARSCKASRYR